MESPPPRPSPALPAEIVEDILLRSPADDPASLVRAALACKLWRRLVSDPGFRRRFRQLHPKPALLGFVCNIGRTNRFFPSCSFRPPWGLDSAFWNWHVIDARHGRVLLHRRGTSWLENLFAVWDPITGVCRRLPGFCRYRSDRRHTWSAAVLCAGGDACDHLDCHGGPFQVVVVGSSIYNVMCASVYSSQTCQWNQPGPLQTLHHGAVFEIEAPSALVGNALYFMFQGGTNLLEYNLASQKMSVIGLPLPPPFYVCCSACVSVTKDGRLGFARIENSKLYLWSRKAAGHPGWTLSRAIELKNLFALGARPSVPLHVVAIVDGVGVCFVDTHGSLFTVGLNSRQVKKICNVRYNRSSYIFPYMSFFTPALRAASTARDQGRMHKVLDKEKMLSFWSLDQG